MATRLIVNGNAGSAAAERLAALRAMARKANLEWCLTEQAGHAARLAREAARRGDERIIVCGGDGTINEALQGLRDHLEQVTVGIVPLGTGNDLARSVGVRELELAEVLAIAIQHEGAFVVVGQITSPELEDEPHLFLNAVAAGVGPVVVSEVGKEEKGMLGPLSYWRAGAARITDPPVYDLQLTLENGESFAGRSHGWLAANGRYIGGGLAMVNSAVLNDRSISLQVLPAQDTMENLETAVDILHEKEEQPRHVREWRLKSFSFASSPPMPVHVDGESIGDVQGAVRIAEQQLRVAVDPVLATLRANEDPFGTAGM